MAKKGIVQNYSILLAVSDAVDEGKYFAVESYLEYCPHCGWLREPTCLHSVFEQVGVGFIARLIRSVHMTDEIFVLLVGVGAESVLIPVPWNHFQIAKNLMSKENLLGLIGKAITPYIKSNEVADEILVAVATRENGDD